MGRRREETCLIGAHTPHLPPFHLSFFVMWEGQVNRIGYYCRGSILRLRSGQVSRLRRAGIELARTGPVGGSDESLPAGRQAIPTLPAISGRNGTVLQG